MSEGPLTELVALGAQNIDLVTTDINKSIFQDPVKQITNFSKASFNIYNKGKADWGSTITFNIERKGDLLSTVYLVLKLPSISVADISNINPLKKDPLTSDLRVAWSNILGYALIEKASISIGGQLIDDQSGEFMQLISDMRDDYNRFFMLGHDGIMNKPSTSIEGQIIYIPLKFWFTQNINKALPLIALQNHKIEIKIKIRNFNEVVNVFQIVKDEDGSTTIIHSDKKIKKKSIQTSHLDCTYIYLSPEERKALAEKEHKILITQCQERKYNIKNNTVELDFNHLVKEIFFFIQPKQNLDEGEIFNFSGKLKIPPSKFNQDKYENTSNNTKYKTDELVQKDIIEVNSKIKKINLSIDLWKEIPARHYLKRARILLNGHERIQWKDHKYFYYVQPWENFKNPNTSHYYIYSFSANSRSLGNYGGCNFSRIDNAQLQLEFNKPITKKVSRISNSTVTIGDMSDGILSVYAHNFNYLIIKGGMAGLQFSN